MNEGKGVVIRVEQRNGNLRGQGPHVILEPDVRYHGLELYRSQD
jgi:hypothetical protein